MKNFIEPIEKLIGEFSRLPGVGKKTATRYAYKIINMKEEDVQSFASSMLKAKQNVHFCKICGNWTDEEICDICKKNNQKIICVVEEPKDIFESVLMESVYEIISEAARDHDEETISQTIMEIIEYPISM